MLVEIHITLKETVVDPQGMTIQHALQSLGYNQASNVRIGKLVTMQLDETNPKAAKETIDQMCQKLLANPIIEDYTYEIKESESQRVKESER